LARTISRPLQHASLVGKATTMALTPAQQQKRAQIENKFKELVTDIDATAQHLKKSMPGYIQADRENKRDLMNEARDLMDDAEEVNENYEDAFNNLGRNTNAHRGQHGLPDISFNNKESIVDGFEGAIQSDVENTRDWISLGQERQAFEHQQQQKFKGEFHNEVESIGEDIDDLMRTIHRPATLTRIDVDDQKMHHVQMEL